MLGRRPLLPGKDYIDQLKLTIQKLGTPNEEDLHFITNPVALKIINNNGTRIPRIDWSVRYPKANPLALDLLDKMLQFNPNKRISVIDALAHPWLQDYAAPHDEPVSRPIDPHGWAFDMTSTPLSKSEIQSLMLKEMEFFRPNNDRLRPQSTRLAALGKVTNTNNTTATTTNNTGNTKHTSPPMNQVDNSKKESKTNATSVNPVQGKSASITETINKYAKTTSTNTTINSVAAILASAANTNNVVVKAAPPVVPANTVSTTNNNPGVEVNKATVPTVTATSTTSNTDILLAALLDQMKGFRQDLLLSIDQRTTSVVEKQFETRLEPLMNKITELENKLNNTSTK